MSGGTEYSRIDTGYVRIETQPDGLRNVTVLRTPDGDAANKSDVVCVHMRCRAIDVDSRVRLVDAGDNAKRSVTPTVLYQSYRTKTVVIRPGERGV